MFGINRKKRQKTGREAWTDKAAGTIAGAAIMLQTGFATTMNGLASKMSERKLKCRLFAFCLISGGFSMYLAAHAIWRKENVQPAIEVKPIRVPRHYDQTGSAVNAAGDVVPEALYRDIQEYKRYLDSLGQPIRPGLRDSIQVLEQLYHSQKIK